MIEKRIREIPYNYTSYSDCEIVWRFLGRQAWVDLEVLRGKRKTGRSARMLFQILGDVWVVRRNPFLQEDLLNDARRRRELRSLHEERLKRIEAGAGGDERVLRVLAQARKMVDDFFQWFEEEPKRRKRAMDALFKVTHRNNVHFDPFARVSHATDATDWRHDLPFCVVTPDHEEEIPKIVRVAKKLGYALIPRGGGTGLCGGSVPLDARSIIINTEKLDRIGRVEWRDVGGRQVPTITAQCGAVTGKVMQAAKPYVFATDPTSLWACTIGGNVATNAGGKHAVIWGTCLDNLLAWRMVTPDGNWLEVERINHSLGKIRPEETLTFRLRRFGPDGRKRLGEEETLTIKGSELRKTGLGKDVTRKALGGLPGVQKEGTDGLVTQATFILHEPFPFTRTVCCEFFGSELSLASRAMVEIKACIDQWEGAHIEALEHFDAKYIKAIDYVSKSARRERPKVVLLIDVSGDEAEVVGRACSAICRIASKANGEGFVAVEEEDRKRFWSDRGRLAAIAKHTRAFKLNEDVVIPLERLSEYNDFVERLNIQHSIRNKLESVQAIQAFLSEVKESLIGSDERGKKRWNPEEDPFLAEKIDRAKEHLAHVARRWSMWLDGLDMAAKDAIGVPEKVGEESLFRCIQKGQLRISYRQEIEKVLRDIFRGHDAILSEIKAIHRKVLSQRIVIATHMHAGDGNVHTNIPVNSNDYRMMHDAHKVVEQVMKKACELGGVISGEHGIGITKLPFMPSVLLEEMARYKEKVDPEQCFNPGKLLPGTDLRFAYTPSFNLMEMEALILEAGDINQLAESISACLRCGKCKPVCNTHFPRANMLYAPRNKILATAAIIEAFLYESQTGSGISFEQFANLRDVAAHCTLCHKCKPPCPVGIDFGIVTERMRALLNDHGAEGVNLGSKLALAFLVLQHPLAIQGMRAGIIRLGYRMQRMAHRVVKRLRLTDKERSPGKGVPEQVINFVKRPLPRLPAQTARAALGLHDAKGNAVPVLRHPDRAGHKAVFYFPGCGSERLYSQIALATEAILFDLGLHVVLPPTYLCCGYPSKASGDHVRAERITYDNRVLFHRLRNALGYLDFEAVIVSCGTCYDQLETYELDRVFEGTPLIDIHEYLVEKGVCAPNMEGERFIYHDPCHTPMKRFGSRRTIQQLFGTDPVESPECCGEAGTLSVAHPDIAGKIRMRKEEQMKAAKNELRQRVGDVAGAKVLTSCPSCLQGLKRIEEVSGVQAEYIVVQLAKTRFGEHWQEWFLERIKAGGMEKVLI